MLALESDRLSKGKFFYYAFRAFIDNVEVPDKRTPVPQALLDWVNNPVEDNYLEYLILGWVLGYNC